MSVILVDGVEYRLKKPSDERQLEEAVKEHSKEIFGKDSIYFDSKHKLSSKSGVVSIPDGYVLSLSKPHKWYIVEGELSDHPLHEHITDQLNRFYVGIKNPTTQRELIDLLYSEINNSKPLRAYVEDTIGSTEIKGFLLDLISKPPRVVVIIEEMGEKVREACDGLKAEPIAMDFKTYVREDAPSIHAHLFKPISEAVPFEEGIPKQDIEQKKSELLEYVESDELKELLSECLKRFGVLNLEVKTLKGHWISVWYKGKRFIYLAARQKFFKISVQKPDGKWLDDSQIRNKAELEDLFKNKIVPTLEEFKAIT